MNDRIAFEHKLFQLISEEFPFLEFLYISNSYPMQDKQHLFTLIIFLHLTLLDLKCALDFSDVSSTYFRTDIEHKLLRNKIEITIHHICCEIFQQNQILIDTN